MLLASISVFFDGDDYIEKNTIELCVNEINESNSQVVLFGNNSIDVSGKTIAHLVPNTPKLIYEGTEVQETDEIQI